MNKKNFILIFILGVVPEVLMAIYLEDIWYKDFFDSLLGVYGILLGLWLMRFILGEISFRLFVQKKFIETLYSQLVDNKFPNPGNYYIDDGITYFQDVGRNLNHEDISQKVCSLASELYGQLKGLYDCNQLSLYFRFKRCLKIAVKKFYDMEIKKSEDISARILRQQQMVSEWGETYKTPAMDAMAESLIKAFDKVLSPIPGANDPELMNIFEETKSFLENDRLTFSQINSLKSWYEFYNPDNLEWGEQGRIIDPDKHNIADSRIQSAQKIIDQEAYRRGIDNI